MGFLKSIGELMKLMQLPPERRQLLVYSESRNYWPYLGGMVTLLAQEYNQPLCYISSDAADAGLHQNHPNITPILTDLGFVRNWLFENLQAQVMLLTMPSLDQYQVKRSRHAVHYIYCQHSLVSLHMIYQEHAFDAYDTIFCAAKHHEAEIRAMEAYYKLPPKQLLAHGYAPVDKLMANRQPMQPLLPNDTQHILFAPTWGKDALIESGEMIPIMDWLLAHGHQVTLRPHPQTLRLSKPAIDAIIKQYGHHPHFTFEQQITDHHSLHQAHRMISDWSGAALDFAFGLGKPVISVDVPRKINNPHYTLLGIEPFEATIRPKLGHVLPAPSIITPSDFDQHMKQALACELEANLVQDNLYNPCESDKIGAAYISQLLHA